MSKIEWTEKTWNFLAGCKMVSPGCVNCYALAMAKRLVGSGMYPEGVVKGDNWSGNVTVLTDKIKLPYSWKKPQMVFVNSMSDTFHEQVTPDTLSSAWDVMKNTPHTYQMLTKRAERMRAMAQILGYLPNQWFGVSVENYSATPRILELERMPQAAVRFLSIEPMLDNNDIFVQNIKWNLQKGIIDLVIIGGESGPKARPFNLLIASWIVDACQKFDVPVFVKQLGTVWAKANGSETYKGSDPAEWPVNLRIRQMPKVTP